MRTNPAIAMAPAITVVAKQGKSALRPAAALQVLPCRVSITEFATMLRAVVVGMVERKESIFSLAAARTAAAIGVQHFIPQFQSAKLRAIPRALTVHSIIIHRPQSRFLALPRR